MSTGIGPEFHVGRPEPERLLDHPGAHGDAGTRVVLGERDVRRADPEDERGVDLEVRVLGSEIRLVDGDEEIFLLLGVDELDRALPHHILKDHLAVSETLDVVVVHLRNTAFDHDQRAARPAAIGMDDDVVVEFLVGYVDLGGDLAVPTHLAHPPDQFPRVVHKPDKGPVNEDT